MDTSKEDKLRPGNELCTIYITVDFTDFDEPSLWSLVSESAGDLRAECSEAVFRRLGPRFEIKSMTFARGSVEIVAIIGAIGTFVANYGGLREGIDYLVGDMRSTVQAFFGRRVPTSGFVSARWSPGPMLSQPTRTGLSWLTALPSDIVLLYLLFSHAVLLALFVWVIVRRLGI